jgi:hypothetical protein
MRPVEDFEASFAFEEPQEVITDQPVLDPAGTRVGANEIVRPWPLSHSVARHRFLPELDTHFDAVMADFESGRWVLEWIAQFPDEGGQNDGSKRAGSALSRVSARAI